MPLIDAPIEAVRAAALATTKDVMNPGSLDKIDRYEMPGLSMFMKNKKARPFIRGRFHQSIGRATDSSLQYIQRKERLLFEDTEHTDEMVWDGARIHKGREFAHADFEEKGFNVVCNDGNGKGPSMQKMSTANGKLLYDAYKEWMEEFRDATKVGIDYDLWRDGSQSPLALSGVDALLPLDNLAGTIGGKDRSDPSFRHIVITGSTTGAGGSIERDLNKGVRLAENFTRGFSSKIDTIFAGDDWIDAYVAYAKANGIEYRASVDKPHGVDIGIPDSGLRWNGRTIVRVPTFAILDANGDYDGTPWAKRAYFLNSKTWELAYQEGKDMAFRAPVDPSDQLISRFSIFCRYALTCRFPRGQFVNTIS